MRLTAARVVAQPAKSRVRFPEGVNSGQSNIDQQAIRGRPSAISPAVALGCLLGVIAHRLIVLRHTRA
jgi:hypothetical protein